MDNITASELAGFGVGTLLLCATIAAPKIDSFISASQRSSLGMCKRCGDLRLIACSTCRGIGAVKANGPIRFDLLDDVLQTLGGSGSDARTTRCTKCRAKGHFPCPDCSAS
ncbi:hypothetical protein SAY87_007624 [Trapa incisa]|uniref:Uncharacterized protein n=1 Tax=Trapa incisa TaxID=236973 RepID=A0AAN7KN52_9MYRT|nr:hypothetical protein SAY87_007624 [Trapa incisa]